MGTQAGQATRQLPRGSFDQLPRGSYKGESPVISHRSLRRHIAEKTAVATPLPAASRKPPPGEVLGTLRNCPAGLLPVQLISDGSAMKACGQLSEAKVAKAGAHRPAQRARREAPGLTDGSRGTALARASL